MFRRFLLLLFILLLISATTLFIIGVLLGNTYSFILQIIKIFPFVYIVAVLVEFSSNDKSRREKPVLVKNTFFLFHLFFSVFWIYLDSYIIPIFYQTEVVNNEKEFSLLLDQEFQKAKEDGSLLKAKKILSYYIRLYPNDRQKKSEYERILYQISPDNVLFRETKDPSSFNAQEYHKSPEELLRTAQTYFEEDDFFSAYFYARLYKESIGTHNSLSQYIVQQSEEMIQEYNDNSLIVKEKQNALEIKNLFNETLNTTNPKKLFSIYESLLQIQNQEKYKTNVLFLYELIQEKMYANALFIENMQVSLLLNPNKYISAAFPQEDYTDILWAEQGSLSPQTIFLKNAEILRISSTGEEIFYIHTPYARIQNGILVLSAISIDNPKEQYFPTLISGNINTLPQHIDIKPSMRSNNLTTPFIATNSYIAQLLPLHGMIRTWNYYFSYNMRAFYLDEVALWRILKILQFIIGGILAAWFGSLYAVRTPITLSLRIIGIVVLLFFTWIIFNAYIRINFGIVFTLQKFLDSYLIISITILANVLLLIWITSSFFKKTTYL